jgi:hypothetical protein
MAVTRGSPSGGLRMLAQQAGTLSIPVFRAVQIAFISLTITCRCHSDRRALEPSMFRLIPSRR